MIGIQIDTPAFDEVTKDVAATFTDQLSTIGGTFGLLTGFSLISAVEILYFFPKFLFNFILETELKCLIIFFLDISKCRAEHKHFT